MLENKLKVTAVDPVWRRVCEEAVDAMTFYVGPHSGFSDTSTVFSVQSVGDFLV